MLVNLVTNQRCQSVIRKQPRKNAPDADISFSGAYLGNLNLDGSVVLGGDEAVSGRALAWDVLVLDISLFVDHI